MPWLWSPHTTKCLGLPVGIFDESGLCLGVRRHYLLFCYLFRKVHLYPYVLLPAGFVLQELSFSFLFSILGGLLL